MFFYRKNLLDFYPAFAPRGAEGDRDKYSGDYRERVTPLPIPNREVKPLIADGTTTEGLWESRSSPGFFSKA